jgi:putative transposase
VRTTGEDAHELELESYRVFASTDLLAEQVVARMLAGLSTRRYPAGLEAVGQLIDAQASGTSKSAVSRRRAPGSTTMRVATVRRLRLGR